MQNPLLLDQAKKLATDLRAFYAAVIAQGGEEPDPKLAEALAVPLCKLTKLLISDVQRKLDEIVYADEHGLKVNEHQHGADMHAKDGGRVELKVSICKRKKNTTKKTCNFNWPVPKGPTEQSRRKQLLDSVKEKTEGGYAHFIVRDGMDHQLASYKLPHKFLMGYFERLSMPKCLNHNLGCEQCHKCKSFHKLDKLQRFADKKTELTAQDWKEVFAETKSQCV